MFHRESKSFKNIERYGGRFRRSDLAEWVWQKHSVKEQELFLAAVPQNRRKPPTAAAAPPLKSP